LTLTVLNLDIKMEEPTTAATTDLPVDTPREDGEEHETGGTDHAASQEAQETVETGGTDHAASQEAQETVETEPESPAVEEEPEICLDPAVIEKLSTGLLSLFLPNLQRAKGSLNEVLHNQEVLIETVTQENAKFTESAVMKDLMDTMREARTYHGKLLNMKKEMNFLMDKSTRLKKRAVKLQQQKHKEALDRAVQRDRELDREKLLTAKVAKPKEQSS